jgi:hypothetical protein
MLLGHFGVALAAKKVAPQASLGTLFLAAQLADFLWPLFLLAGWEQVRVSPGITRVTPLEFVSYPYTHSLLAMMMWSAGLAGGYVLLRRASAVAAQTGGVLAALVVSHWFLDWLVHIPDLPVTWLTGSRYGLGLWNSAAATTILEFGLLAAGCALYFSVTRSKNRAGRLALPALLTLLAVAWLSQFGPPPPGEKAMAFGALLMWLTVPWGAWADRNRAAR